MFCLHLNNYVVAIKNNGHGLSKWLRNILGSMSWTPLHIVHEGTAIVPQFPNVARTFPSSHYREGRLIVSPSQYRSQFPSQSLPVSEDDYERALQTPVSGPPNVANFSYGSPTPMPHQP